MTKTLTTLYKFKICITQVCSVYERSQFYHASVCYDHRHHRPNSLEYRQTICTSIDDMPTSRIKIHLEITTDSTVSTAIYVG